MNFVSIYNYFKVFLQLLVSNDGLAMLKASCILDTT